MASFPLNQTKAVHPFRTGISGFDHLEALLHHGSQSFPGTFEKRAMPSSIPMHISQGQIHIFPGARGIFRHGFGRVNAKYVMFLTKFLNPLIGPHQVKASFSQAVLIHSPFPVRRLHLVALREKLERK